MKSSIQALVSLTALANVLVLISAFSKPGDVSRLGNFATDSHVVLIPQSLELDSLEPGDSRQFEFTMINRSQGMVSIVSHATDCGCTQIRYTRDPLMPGAEATISGRLHAGSTQGPRERWVVISVRDGDAVVNLRSKITYTITATVSSVESPTRRNLEASE